MLLNGLKVLEIGSGISVAYCCKQLADLGAEVVKVENPDKGDELRYYGPYLDGIPDKEKSIPFLYFNTNKQGITLDIKKTSGAKIIQEFLGTFDILITDFPQADLQKWGLDYLSLQKFNPVLIMTSILPYGESEIYKNYKAYNINISAFSGISMVLGEENRKPLDFPYSSLVAGGSAAAATLVAVYDREDTNRGRFIEISEIEVMADLIYDISAGTAWGLGKPFKRIGPRGSQYIYPWTMLQVKDGYITITFLGPKGKEWWQTFLELIGNPEWAQDPRYQDFEAMSAYAEEVDDLLKPYLLKFTKEELFDICKEKGLPVVPVRNPKEAIEDPHFSVQRNFKREIIRSDLYKLFIPGLPFNCQISFEKQTPSPMLGEHNEHLFKKYLGITPKRLNDLHEEGII